MLHSKRFNQTIFFLDFIPYTRKDEVMTFFFFFVVRLGPRIFQLKTNSDFIFVFLEIVPAEIYSPHPTHINLLIAAKFPHVQ